MGSTGYLTQFKKIYKNYKFKIIQIYVFNLNYINEINFNI